MIENLNLSRWSAPIGILPLACCIGLCPLDIPPLKFSPLDCSLLYSPCCPIGCFPLDLFFDQFPVGIVPLVISHWKFAIARLALEFPFGIVPWNSFCLERLTYAQDRRLLASPCVCIFSIRFVRCLSINMLISRFLAINISTRQATKI